MLLLGLTKHFICTFSYYELTYQVLSTRDMPLRGSTSFPEFIDNFYQHVTSVFGSHTAAKTALGVLASGPLPMLILCRKVPIMSTVELQSKVYGEVQWWHLGTPCLEQGHCLIHWAVHALPLLFVKTCSSWGWSFVMHFTYWIKLHPWKFKNIRWKPKNSKDGLVRQE